MAFWEGELKELGSLYNIFRGHLPDIVKEMEQLLKTDDPNVVMLYSRRCLEVIVTDLCENELKRPRKTEPLKGIIDKLNAEEKVPSHIITSMLSLNSMANYGAHPKDFDPEQVKPVLNNLAIIIKWYLKYKDFKIVSKSGNTEKEENITDQPGRREEIQSPSPETRKRFFTPFRIVLLLILAVILAIIFIPSGSKVPEILGSNEWSGHFKDPRDNNIYVYVKIGEQFWMAENLRAVKFNDGTRIPRIKDNEQWEKTTEPAYCWYDNNRSLYGKSMFGPLYNWYTVNTGKLCPAGWHVPSKEEWETLISFAGDSIPADLGYLPVERETAGIKLKESGNEHWAFNDTINSTDAYGFTALPGGFRTINGVFWDIGNQGSWWSSSEYPNDPENKDAVNVEMDFDRNGVTVIHQYRQTGMSVRCIKDKS
ncbi:MAG TPA: fibrobacter succinogenes major paralogous domain-containing protein [Bacteroidales bacterium]|nr:fibrobacter succinogenes major paralogous domain-containing protein [Bacteroidales bacterium]HPF01745.1 fibrobacter succinogenes major paralogous domain-containing protein [Bacteroidales bacterium]HPJ59735.1 fibrobacter succinogenes major paralogous domain-containing protein [Bacteroidales bacterium]HPR11775.1 fibrobacter succinogenes major paralogous domain-containing protein [Bacteroidales bacterium]HRW84076.1 fibrobacter succinogenes major paralogous domain-containing protein [Bacteroidal